MKGKVRDRSGVWCRSRGRGSLVQELRRAGAVTGAEAGEGAVFGAGAGVGAGAVFDAEAGEEATFSAGAEKNRGSVWCRSREAQRQCQGQCVMQDQAKGQGQRLVQGRGK